MNDITAPTRRTSWTTFHLVEKVISLYQEGVPKHEIRECLQSLGVSTTRITELLNGGARRC